MSTRVYRRRGRGVGCFGMILIMFIVGGVWWLLSHLWPLFLVAGVVFIGYKGARIIARHRKAKEVVK